MGASGRKSTAAKEELISDQDTRQISASQLAEVLARVDGDRQSEAFERGEGRISGARRISDLRSTEDTVSEPPVSAQMLTVPHEERQLDSSRQLPVAESSVNVRVVTAHQNTRAMTVALVLAVATFFAAILLAYRY